MVYTDEFLIDELYRFVDEFVFVPTQKQIDAAEGYPSASVYQSHFGSFNGALEIANLPLNMTHEIRTGFETCCICGNYLKQGQQWHTKGLPNGNVMCQSCYNNPDYINGNLDINSAVGRGRSGEILVTKVLDIGKDHDCNRISCGHKFDLYSEEYDKIDVKTSLFSCDHNNWSFNFNAKKEADTYICVGLSSSGNKVEHVWIVLSEAYIRNLQTFTVRCTNRSLSNHLKWEINAKKWDKVWQEMINNYQNGKCKIFK